MSKKRVYFYFVANENSMALNLSAETVDSVEKSLANGHLIDLIVDDYKYLINPRNITLIEIEEWEDE